MLKIYTYIEKNSTSTESKNRKYRMENIKTKH